MASSRASQDSWLFTLLGFVLIVAVLWAAQVVLIPLALAVLLSFLLAPLCVRLERWRLGRVMSVLSVTVLSFIILGAVGWVVTGQIIDLAGKLPQYQDNIREKIRSLQLPTSGPLGRATHSIREITKEIEEAEKQTADSLDPLGEQTAEPAPEPMPVQIVEDAPHPVQTIAITIGPLLAPLASAAIVIVFVIFMLLQRDDLRDRILSLIGQGRLTIATQAIDDAASRVSRYLLMQFIINATYGIAAGIGLFLIGVPNAVLWGVVATLLRFIPYVGPWLGALLPIAFSLAVFDGWTRVMMTAALFIVIELISNNVMEPLLYGSRTGISPVAVLVSAVFWAWLWGPVGLVLATPLTVCLVVLGRYIPKLEFLSVLLSDEPGLTPAARVYQRLLAMDQDTVYEMAATYLEDHSLLEVYEDMLLPALALAERDRHHSRIEATREQAVYENLRDLVEDLGSRPQPAANSLEDESHAEGSEQRPESESAITESKAAAFSPHQRPGRRSVLCIAARDVADEIAAFMLVQTLRAQSIDAEVAAPGRMIGEMLEEIEQRQPDALCISAMPPQALVRTRHLCQRLIERMPDLRIVVGMWTVTEIGSYQRRLTMCAPDRVVSTLSEAIELVRQ